MHRFVLLDRLKIAGRATADGADIVLGKGVALIDKAADFTYKALGLVRKRLLLRGRLFTLD